MLTQALPAEAAEDGGFLIPLLPLGPYTVTAENAGFTRYVQRGIYADAMGFNLGVLSEPVTLPVTAASPGVFTTNVNSGIPGVGPDRAFVYNEDGKQNSPREPAPRGSLIKFFATGEGGTDPPGVDAGIAGEVLPKPVLPAAVRIGGVEAEILYATRVERRDSLQG